jgi:hypothetical protein
MSKDDPDDALGLYAALSFKFEDVQGRLPTTTQELEEWLASDVGKIALAQVGADYGLED